MRKINPISFLWDDAYNRLCTLAVDWCASGMPETALNELYQFSESKEVTDLQLETDEIQEAILYREFEEAFHALVAKYGEEYDRVKLRATEEQMEQFLSGHRMSDRFQEVAQQIRTQRASIQTRMEQIEARLKFLSREEREELRREYLYLAHQSGAWSEELLRRLEKKL